MKLKLLAVVALVASGQGAGAITTSLGAPEVAVVGVGFDVGEDGLPNLGFGEGHCRGVMAVSMVCSLALTAYVKVCVDFEASALGVPVSGQACAETGGAVANALSITFVETALESSAKTTSYMPPYQRGTGTYYCAQYVDVGDVGGWREKCSEKMEEAQDVYIDEDTCIENRQWIEEHVDAYINDPWSIPSNLPGQNVIDCPSSAGVQSGAICSEMTAHAEAHGDVFTADPSDSQLGDCSHEPAAEGAPGFVCQIQDDSDEPECEGDDQMSSSQMTMMRDVAIAKALNHASAMLMDMRLPVVAEYADDENRTAALAMYDATAIAALNRLGRELRDTYDERFIVRFTPSL